MILSIYQEYELDDSTREAVSQLFAEAFEGYPADRIYFHQIPNFRIIGRDDSGHLLAHVGVHYRIIRLDRTCYSIFGLADVCVTPTMQLRQLGTQLLCYVDALATNSGVAFQILSTERDGFYQKCGFKRVNNPCRWLMIHQHQSYGVLKRHLTPGLMIKEMNNVAWTDGEVDFLGSMF